MGPSLLACGSGGGLINVCVDAADGRGAESQHMDAGRGGPMGQGCVLGANNLMSALPPAAPPPSGPHADTVVINALGKDDDYNDHN